jgi:adenylosuccinate synthase
MSTLLTARPHIQVNGFGFGDEGKGSTVDYLASLADKAGHQLFTTVVKTNGGAQTAHNVITDDGRHHTFAQFGSGTFKGARTFLSRFCLVNPLALHRESEYLAEVGVQGALDLVSVDPRALITTPFHAEVNRARELARGGERHGSCGVGIGETMVYARQFGSDAPVMADCANPPKMRRKLGKLYDYYTAAGFNLGATIPLEELVEIYGLLAQMISITDEDYLMELLTSERVIFEGAQGVLLDQWYAFHPHATYSTTTFENGQTLLAETGQAGLATRLGVIRAYQTRHGAGPMPTESEDLGRAAPDVHNGGGTFTGDFRVGHLDLVLLRYALEVAGAPDCWSLTNLDRVAIEPSFTYTRAYEIDGHRVERLIPPPGHDLDYQRALTQQLWVAQPILEARPDSFVELVEDFSRAPVGLLSRGPRTADKTTYEKRSTQVV